MFGPAGPLAARTACGVTVNVNGSPDLLVQNSEESTMTLLCYLGLLLPCALIFRGIQSSYHKPVIAIVYLIAEVDTVHSKLSYTHALFTYIIATFKFNTDALITSSGSGSSS